MMVGVTIGVSQIGKMPLLDRFASLSFEEEKPVSSAVIDRVGIAGFWLGSGPEEINNNLTNRPFQALDETNCQLPKNSRMCKSGICGSI
jgi:hypothetical protein